MFLPELGVDTVLVGGPGRIIDGWVRRAPLGRFVHSPNFPGRWASARGLTRLTVPWRYMVTGWRARREFQRIVEREQIDVIVASLPFAWIVGTLVARKAGIPIVWRAGGIQVPLWQRIGLRLLTRFLRPDVLVCNGEAVRRVFEPLVRAPVVVFPNGVNTEKFHPSAGEMERYRPPGARSVVGFAGRLVRSKHPEAVIALAERLREVLPDAHVLVAGDGPERDRSEKKARSLGLENVCFLGFVEDMSSFYAACDVIVLPSETEGCSNVILEAMMSERAVVCADIPPVREFVKHGETGLVYSEGDTDALTDLVREILLRNDARKELARAGRASAQGFTAPVAARRLAELLRGLVFRRRATRDRERSVIPFPSTRPRARLAKVSSNERRSTRS